MEFKNATERRAWLLARVEEVERRRNAALKLRPRNKRDRIREFVAAHPGSTITQIATALGLTQQQVWATQLHREFIQTRDTVERHQTRWWPRPLTVKAENDQVV